ncbi:MAG: hypothetical protein B0D92_06435 [Spirochaeta sp. LUC14_002_19_P3]|nr:MAG: hypothetical protein B0D92_06435 [Spirochaeta sp. LUC14_002_19_P3]
MDVQLKELIDKIKNDGVKSAEEEAERILSEARDEAESLVRKAKDEAKHIRATAQADAQRAEQSGTEALKQAGRDLQQVVRANIEGIFNSIVNKNITGVLDAKTMSEAVMAAVRHLASEGASNLDVQLPESEFAAVEQGLRKQLAEELAGGMEIIPFKGLDAGFHIAVKDGSAFYDFSDKELTAMLSRFLNPRLSKLLSG